MASEAAPCGPYLERLQNLVHAYPPLVSFLGKITNEDMGRRLVREHYAGTSQQRPGRCTVLSFGNGEVNEINWSSAGARSPAVLSDYLTTHPAIASRQNDNRRLFILEDLNPGYVDVLGEHLGVDPLVFSEQMNTWNYADSVSIPYRGLPSLSSPERSFTLRYHEIRTLQDPSSIDRLTFQMTFAVNRRRYERWRDVDLPLERMTERHAFVRRCASFWTSQHEESGVSGWDAIIMVDPSMEIPQQNAPPRCLILKDHRKHTDRASLWNASVWDSLNKVETIHNASRPYHDGCPALAPLLFPHSSDKARLRLDAFHQPQHRASPLDEQVFYWTRIASKDLIAKTNSDSCNTAYYLLKHIAQHWTHQLELINCTVAVAEWFSDDYQAKTDHQLDGGKWRADLEKVNKCTMDINYMRRQMNHFWRAMVLNIERLDVQLGNEEINTKLPLALSDAQKDFLTIHARMEFLRQRVASLGDVATDLASLQAAFKGTHDSEFSLRLGVFASTVFPVTLIASIFSMGDDFLPGKGNFWMFWACSVPLVIVSWVLLRYGTGLRFVRKEVECWMKDRKRRRATGTAAVSGERWEVRVRARPGTIGTKVCENCSLC